MLQHNYCVFCGSCTRKNEVMCTFHTGETPPRTFLKEQGLYCTYCKVILDKNLDFTNTGVMKSQNCFCLSCEFVNSNPSFHCRKAKTNAPAYLQRKLAGMQPIHEKQAYQRQLAALTLKEHVDG